MALRLTKTSKIVFAISIVVLSIALGYLVWRVNQEDRLDPSDSDAGGTGTGCSTAVTNACRDTCPEGFNGFLDCKEDGVVCGNVACGTAARCLCCTGQWATADDGDCDKACGTWGYGADCDDEDGDNEVVKCFCESWSDGCGTNCTFPDGTQAEVDSKARASCKPYIAMCNVNDGSISIDEYTSSHVCYNKVAQCKNPYADNPCVETSSCDSGSWVTRPTGNIDFNTDILFSATALDSDGINSSSITAKLCTGSIATCTTGQSISYTVTNTTATTATFGGTLSNSTNRLSPGTYTLSLAWADSLGATGASCALTTSFVLLEEETNPNWDISKSVVESCLDEGTEDPVAQLTYTITVRNTGDGDGTIEKITDDLDSKVLASFVQTGITSPGTYSNGTIVWDYTGTPLNIAAGSTKTYTYTMLVDKDSFGVYGNTVTLDPSVGENITATASIDADCEILIPEEPEEPETPEEPTPEETIPETGIFDSTVGRVSVGLILVILGGIVYSMPNGIFRIEKNTYKYRERFERKVANK